MNENRTNHGNRDLFFFLLTAYIGGSTTVRALRTKDSLLLTTRGLFPATYFHTRLYLRGSGPRVRQEVFTVVASATLAMRSGSRWVTLLSYCALNISTCPSGAMHQHIVS